MVQPVVRAREGQPVTGLARPGDTRSRGHAGPLGMPVACPSVIRPIKGRASLWWGPLPSGLVFPDDVLGGEVEIDLRGGQVIVAEEPLKAR